MTGNEPTAAMSAAVMAAVTRVALTTVVVRAAPFHSSTAPDAKLLPSAVSVKAAPPATALAGVSVVSVGPVDGAPVQLTWMTAAPPCS